MLYSVQDLRSGSPVWIAGDRQERPNLPTGSCAFCPGGLEAPEPYDVRWFVNRWPAMPDDRCEVVLYSPEHDRPFSGLGVQGIRRVLDVWAERTLALGARDDVDAVLPFENRGAEVGATISHPHGQIYAFEAVPPVLERELAAPACWVCPPPSPELVVSDIGVFQAHVPVAARYPYELLVTSRVHRPDLPSLDDSERDDLAAVLQDSLGRLDRLFDAAMPYMLWVHQRPTDGRVWPTAHVHVEIAALLRSPATPRYVAAGEIGSGVWFNPMPPEVAARRLRDADGLPR